MMDKKTQKIGVICSIVQIIINVNLKMYSFDHLRMYNIDDITKIKSIHKHPPDPHQLLLFHHIDFLHTFCKTCSSYIEYILYVHSNPDCILTSNLLLWHREYILLFYKNYYYINLYNTNYVKLNKLT